MMGNFHHKNYLFPIAAQIPMLYSFGERAKDMGLRESFQKLIEKKQDEYRELELRMREVQAYIQALQDSVRLLPKEGSSNPLEKKDVTLREGTNLARARAILLEAKTPLHVNEILSKMGKPTDQATRVSLVGTLGSYARKGKIFTRTGPNIFGLIEFYDDNEEPVKVKSAEDLPLEFGKSV